jgi:hypothetical protein
MLQKTADERNLVNDRRTSQAARVLEMMLVQRSARVSGCADIFSAGIALTAQKVEQMPERGRQGRTCRARYRKYPADDRE